MPKSMKLVPGMRRVVKYLVHGSDCDDDGCCGNNGGQMMVLIMTVM